ncbi:hypothetical protein BC826DRAFT_1058735, partial [Russula brevipes]
TLSPTSCTLSLTPSTLLVISLPIHCTRSSTARTLSPTSCTSSLTSCTLESTPLTLSSTPITWLPSLSVIFS